MRAYSSDKNFTQCEEGCCMAGKVSLPKKSRSVALRAIKKSAKHSMRQSLNKEE
mgnify:FL=1